MKNLILCISLLVGLVSEARWATLEDASVVSEFDRYDIRVLPWGAWTESRENRLVIRNEDGRNTYGTTSLKYNARTTRIKNLKAETIYRNKVYPVSKEYIEDKSLASTSDGF